MRTPLIAGNWKMNGLRSDAVRLADELARHLPDLHGVEMVVCPPFVHLEAVKQPLTGTAIAIGAQNCADAALGARTGEVAAEMLADLGVRHVILGHSERREYYAEDDRVIAARYQRAMASGLVPILCVGETLEQRDAGRSEAIVEAQIRGITDLIGADGLGAGVIAYEPVWAIGTGRTATAEQAQSMHRFIRECLAAIEGHDGAAERRLLYGGSMKPDNAAELLVMEDVDGGLVGGASLNAEGFAAICAAVPRG